MRKKKPKNKLLISTEKVRPLDPEKLPGIAGGAVPQTCAESCQDGSLRDCPQQSCYHSQPV
jgi:hypothetical protein